MKKNGSDIPMPSNSEQDPLELYFRECFRRSTTPPVDKTPLLELKGITEEVREIIEASFRKFYFYFKRQQEIVPSTPGWAEKKLRNDQAMTSELYDMLSSFRDAGLSDARVLKVLGGTVRIAIDSYKLVTGYEPYMPDSNIRK